MEFVQELQRRRSSSAYDKMIEEEGEAELFSRGFDQLWASEFSAREGEHGDSPAALLLLAQQQFITCVLTGDRALARSTIAACSIAEAAASRTWGEAAGSALASVASWFGGGGGGGGANAGATGDSRTDRANSHAALRAGFASHAAALRAALLFALGHWGKAAWALYGAHQSFAQLPRPSPPVAANNGDEKSGGAAAAVKNHPSVADQIIESYWLCGHGASRLLMSYVPLPGADGGGATSLSFTRFGRLAEKVLSLVGLAPDRAEGGRLLRVCVARGGPFAHMAATILAFDLLLQTVLGGGGDGGDGGGNGGSGGSGGGGSGGEGASATLLLDQAREIVSAEQARHPRSLLAHWAMSHLERRSGNLGEALVAMNKAATLAGTPPDGLRYCRVQKEVACPSYFFRRAFLAERTHASTYFLDTILDVITHASDWPLTCVAASVRGSSFFLSQGATL